MVGIVGCIASLCVRMVYMPPCVSEWCTCLPWWVCTGCTQVGMYGVYLRVWEEGEDDAQSAGHSPMVGAGMMRRVLSIPHTLGYYLRCYPCAIRSFIQFSLDERVVQEESGHDAHCCFIRSQENLKNVQDSHFCSEPKVIQ